MVGNILVSNMILSNMMVGNMTVAIMRVDNMLVNNMTVDNMTVNNMTVDNMTVDNMTVDNMTVGNVEVDKRTQCHKTNGHPITATQFFFFTSLYYSQDRRSVSHSLRGHCDLCSNGHSLNACLLYHSYTAV
jgi:hypothetical protein